MRNEVPDTYPRRRNGRQWVAHVGRGERLRKLRQMARPALKLKDEASVKAVERIRLSTADEPEPEYAMLHLIAAALQSANDCKVDFAQAANFMMDRFDKAAEVPDGAKA